jgi:multidrug transporter EmrE-like cation transporter
VIDSKARVSSELLYTVYALASAACYVGATVVMKYYDKFGLVKAGPSIAVFLVGAVFFETVALKTERLGMILLMILGFESALGLLMSWLWFQESYTVKEVLGLALIVAGVGLTKL